MSLALNKIPVLINLKYKMTAINLTYSLNKELYIVSSRMTIKKLLQCT